MKRKGLVFGCISVSAVAGFLLVINRFMTALPDWAVRMAGIILMVGLVAVVFFAVRTVSENKATE
ncbi:MAG: hypothetical protein PHP22_08635 [Oscillospiraceae bacterium]|nr:hypothetical protein [Oscillospiraceae bacterium]